MATAKLEEFKERDVKLTSWLKALSHPARLAILTTLAQKSDCICGDLVLDLPLAQSTISQHLKSLKEAGLIKGEIDGPRSRYCVNWVEFERMQKYFGTWSETMSALQKKNSC